MTKHLYIDEYGSFVGKISERLAVYQDGELKAEIPLSRLKSVNILKGGISLSSDIIEACSLRGIKIFFLILAMSPIRLSRVRPATLWQMYVGRSFSL